MYFGYSLSSDGKLEIKEQEAEIVAFFFKRNAEYAENPPEELVKTIYEEKYAFDPTYTLEMAKEDATESGRTLDYAIKDVIDMYGDRIAKAECSSLLQ